MVSLARQSLLHDWRRFAAAAVVSLAFAGLLVLVQIGLLYGMFDTLTLPLKRTSADLWVTSRDIEGWDESSLLAARYEGLLWSHPSVVDVQTLGASGAEWRSGNGMRHGVTVISVDTRPGSVTLMRGLDSPTVRDALAEPGMVLIDSTDAHKLNARIGSRAEIGGKRVRVAGMVSGMRSAYGAYVLASHATARQLGIESLSEGSRYFLIRLAPGADSYVVRRELDSSGGQRFAVWRPDELIERSNRAWLAQSGSGASFAFSTLIALLVGVGVTSQTLRSAILATLKEYAALRALGVKIGRLRAIVLEQSLWVAALGIALMAVVAFLMAVLGKLMGVPLSFPWWSAVATSVFIALIAVASGLMSLGQLYRSEPADLLR